MTQNMSSEWSLNLIVVELFGVRINMWLSMCIRPYILVVGKVIHSSWGQLISSQYSSLLCDVDLILV